MGSAEKLRISETSGNMRGHGLVECVAVGREGERFGRGQRRTRAGFRLTMWPRQISGRVGGGRGRGGLLSPSQLSFPQFPDVFALGLCCLLFPPHSSTHLIP